MTLSILDGKKVLNHEYYSDMIESIKIIDSLLIINLEVSNVQCGWSGCYYLLYENKRYCLVLKDYSRQYDLVVFDKKEGTEITSFKKNPLYCDKECLFDLGTIRYYYILEKDLTEEELKFIREYSMLKELRK